MHGETRELSVYEQEAWDEYERLLDIYDVAYKVKRYDRVSVLEAFPELQDAFNRAVEAKLFYELSK